MSGSGVLKRASFYAMKLYSHHAQPIPLRLEQTGDALDLFACGSDDRQALVIFAVNLKPQPVELNIRFQGFGATPRVARAEALCDVQNRGQPDVMNHWRTPERLGIIPVPVSPAQVSVPGLSAMAVECVTN
jgi:hypothetical protein